jgi:hypothetical protein
MNGRLETRVSTPNLLHQAKAGAAAFAAMGALGLTAAARAESAPDSLTNPSRVEVVAEHLTDLIHQGQELSFDANRQITWTRPHSSYIYDTDVVVEREVGKQRRYFELVQTGNSLSTVFVRPIPKDAKIQSRPSSLVYSRTELNPAIYPTKAKEVLTKAAVIKLNKAREPVATVRLSDGIKRQTPVGVTHKSDLYIG